MNWLYSLNWGNWIILSAGLIGLVLGIIACRSIDQMKFQCPYCGKLSTVNFVVCPECKKCRHCGQTKETEQ
jgi:hypothetical protein